MKLLILFSSPVLMMVFCLSKEYSWVFIFRFEIRIRPPLKCLQTFSWDYHLAAARIFSQHMKSSLTNIAWKSQHQQNLWTPSTNGSQGIWFGSMQFYQSVVLEAWLLWRWWGSFSYFGSRTLNITSGLTPNQSWCWETKLDKCKLSFKNLKSFGIESTKKWKFWINISSFIKKRGNVYTFSFLEFSNVYYLSFIWIPSSASVCICQHLL